MKKSLFIIGVLICSLLIGCSGNTTTSSSNGNDSETVEETMNFPSPVGVWNSEETNTTLEVLDDGTCIGTAKTTSGNTTITNSFNYTWTQDKKTGIVTIKSSEAEVPYEIITDNEQTLLKSEKMTYVYDVYASAPQETKNINVGETIALEFVEITIDELTEAQEFKYTSGSSGISITTGVYEEEGKTYIGLKGRMKNLLGDAIRPRDIVGELVVDDKYTYEVSVFTCDDNANSGFEIAPLENVNYVIYASVPDELIESYKTCSLRFGFDYNFNQGSFAELDDCQLIYVLTANK